MNFGKKIAPHQVLEKILNAVYLWLAWEPVGLWKRPSRQWTNVAFGVAELWEKLDPPWNHHFLEKNSVCKILWKEDNLIKCMAGQVWKWNKRDVKLRQKHYFCRSKTWMFQKTWFMKLKKCTIKDFSKSHLCTDFGANTIIFGGNFTYLQSRRGLAK